MRVGVEVGLVAVAVVAQEDTELAQGFLLLRELLIPSQLAEAVLVRL